MFRFLLLIKHRCKWLWTFAEYITGLLIGLLYSKSIEKSAKEVLEKASILSRSYRLLTVNDIEVICAFFLGNLKTLTSISNLIILMKKHLDAY